MDKLTIFSKAEGGEAVGLLLQLSFYKYYHKLVMDIYCYSFYYLHLCKHVVSELSTPIVGLYQLLELHVPNETKPTHTACNNNNKNIDNNKNNNI